MSYAYNPSPAEDALLWLIIQRESGGNPTAQNPMSTASGLLQFINGTWAYCCNLADPSGAMLAQYPTAKSAPADVQKAMGLLLLRLYGPNSTRSWKASGPYPTYQEVVGMLTEIGIKT